MNPISVFNAYISYTKSLRDNGLRRANFPEGLSEALAGYTLSKYYSRNISKAPTGDLIDQETKLKYEIKCFSSTGPSSFGPTEAWDSLVFVDFMDYENGNFAVYEFPYKNTSDEIRSLVLNKSKNETYHQQCIDGKRPRICFDEFCKQNENRSKLVTIFKGNINSI